MGRGWKASPARETTDKAAATTQGELLRIRAREVSWWEKAAVDKGMSDRQVGDEREEAAQGDSSEW